MIGLFAYAINFWSITFHFAPYEEEYHGETQYIQEHYHDTIDEQKFSILNDLVFCNVFLYLYHGKLTFFTTLGYILIFVDMIASLQRLKHAHKIKLGMKEN